MNNDDADDAGLGAQGLSVSAVEVEPLPPLTLGASLRMTEWALEGCPPSSTSPPPIIPVISDFPAPALGKHKEGAATGADEAAVGHVPVWLLEADAVGASATTGAVEAEAAGA